MSITTAPTRHRAVRGSGRRRGVVGTLLLLFAGVALVAGVLLLAPTAIGGPASYVVTQGTSMLPTHQPGGVIVTHERDSYGVGDVVASRNPELGDAVVLHRIVDTAGDRFVLQGDNNDFLDSYRPEERDILGEAWFDLPHAGRAVEGLRQPVVFGLVIALVTLVCVRAPRATDRRRRRHHER